MLNWYRWIYRRKFISSRAFPAYYKFSSKLISLMAAILVYNLVPSYAGEYAMLTFFALSLFIDVFNTYVLKRKESDYKRKGIFGKKKPLTIEGYERFHRLSTNVKLFLFLLAMGFIAWGGFSSKYIIFSMCAYGLLSCFAFVGVAMATVNKLKDIHFEPSKSPSMLERMNAESSKPYYYGLAGFNNVGAYTGSSTAMGGMSS